MIVYQVDRDEVFDLWMMNVDGSEKTPLTEDADIDVWVP